MRGPPSRYVSDAPSVVVFQLTDPKRRLSEIVPVTPDPGDLILAQADVLLISRDGNVIGEEQVEVRYRRSRASLSSICHPTARRVP